MEKEEVTISELMDFLQENVATKSDLAELKETMATKDDIAKIYDVMATKDDIAKIYDVMATKDDIARLEATEERHYHELSGYFSYLEREINDIKICLNKLEQRTLDDANVTAKDVLNIRRRVEAVEVKVKELQAA